MQLAQVLANVRTGSQGDIQTDRGYEDGKGNLFSALCRDEDDCTCVWMCQVVVEGVGAGVGIFSWVCM